MHITKRQEQFSLSLVVAVASCAGCSIGQWTVDDDSIDVTLRSKVFPRKPKIDVQLKCTWQEIFFDDEIHYSLSIKNYDDLRTVDVCSPRILVLVKTPTDIERWLHQSEDAATIAHCAYWCNLRGLPPVVGQDSKTVTFPRANIFDPAVLMTMMEHTDVTGTI